MNAGRWIYFAVLALAVTAVFGLPAEAQNGKARVYVAKPLGTDTVTVVVTANGASQSTHAQINKNWTARQKRDAIYNALQKNGYTVNRGAAIGKGNYVGISDLPNNAKVKFIPRKTGESPDQIDGPNAQKGKVRFSGTFPSQAPTGAASTFTGGVATDQGQVVVEVGAGEFPFGMEIEGTFIAERLFADLHGAAAALGAFLELDGDTIHVTFDPMATQGEGGVIFGTTSEGGGIEASIEVDVP